MFEMSIYGTPKCFGASFDMNQFVPHQVIILVDNEMRERHLTFSFILDQVRDNSTPLVEMALSVF